MQSSSYADHLMDFESRTLFEESGEKEGQRHRQNTIVPKSYSSEELHSTLQV